jgi:hypothetical protein
MQRPDLATLAGVHIEIHLHTRIVGGLKLGQAQGALPIRQLVDGGKPLVIGLVPGFHDSLCSLSEMPEVGTGCGRQLCRRTLW